MVSLNSPYSQAESICLYSHECLNTRLRPQSDVHLGCIVVSSSGVAQISHGQVRLLLSPLELPGVRVRVTLRTRIDSGAHPSEVSQALDLPPSYQRHPETPIRVRDHW